MIILRILFSIVTWLAYEILVSLPLSIVDIPICAWLASGRSYTAATSVHHAGRTIYTWSAKWAWLWSNDEDGVLGDPRYSKLHERHPRWGSFIWTAFRNSVNNLRFVPILHPVIDSTQVRWIGNHTNPSARRPQGELARGTVLWALTWQGLYSGYVIRWQVTDTHFFQFRFGWKLLPKDAEPQTPGDVRYIRCPFGIQLQVRTEG